MVPSVDKYQQQLIDEGVLTQEQAANMKQEVMGKFEEAYNKSKSHTFKS
jgi:polyhydroxyalkanoate synthesis regulator phasin